MGMKFFYTGNPHKFTERLSDMKNMMLQKKDYDLDTEIGKENTWHAVNAMILGGVSTFLGCLIGEKISQKFETRKVTNQCQHAFELGQIDAYQHVMKSIRVPDKTKE